MTPPPNDDHDCGWKANAKHQEEKLSELQQQHIAMKAKVEQLALLANGHKSEHRKTSKKMPPPVKAKPELQETLDKRKALAELRNTEVKTETLVIPVPLNQCTCPNCGNSNLPKSVAENRRP